MIALDIPEDLFLEYEHVEEGKTYREAMIPARKLNEYRAGFRLLDDDEEASLTIARWDYWSKRLGT